ncbi:hypothetical protein [Modestobacter italicus]|uniref:hypothetical protein n=1 Tax=Modestobacter italicus (strain DSM 44449 / CECT 9708 / BC 501) TaxID=2732864 RepID=UPI0005A08E4B|nr:hypothetical protein [Modestobacter marinus]
MVSRPAASASPASGSTTAARSVLSTCSATALLTSWPSAWASPRACLASAATTWLRCWPSWRSSGPDSACWAWRSISPTSRSWLTSSGRRRTSRLQTQAAVVGLGSAATALASSLSCPLARSRAAVRAATNSSGGTP